MSDIVGTFAAVTVTDGDLHCNPTGSDRMSRFAWLALPFALASATCAPTAPMGPTDQRAMAPAPPAAGTGMQFTMPETIIPAGAERMMCWVPDWTPDRDYMIQSFTGIQGAGGHHVVALEAAIPVRAGDTFDCTSLASLTGFRPLVLPEGTAESGIPAGYAVRVPAGAKVVIQSHYLNTTARDIRVADVARIMFAPAGAAVTEVSYMILNHGSVSIPARSPGNSRVSCTPQVGASPVNVLNIIGHMHEWGTSIQVKRERAGAMEMIYSVDQWRADYRDLPPTRTWQPSAPLQVQTGDRLSLECNFMNTLDHPLAFPEEMCTTVMMYYPARPERIIQCEE
jgi:Copper type II ascorbate-dependent monooxygenase, C-terminal domain